MLDTPRLSIKVIFGACNIYIYIYFMMVFNGSIFLSTIHLRGNQLLTILFD